MYGNPMFNSLGNWQIVLYSGCTVLHPHQQCIRAPIPPCPYYSLSLYVFGEMLVQVFGPFLNGVLYFLLLLSYKFFFPFWQHGI
jgi:hypothetical protein